MSSAETLTFYGAPIENLSMDEAVEYASELIDRRKPSVMVSLNIDILKLYTHNKRFKDAYNTADIRLLDSQPLFNIAKKQGMDIKEKVCGSDYMPRVCEMAAEKGYSCYILGGAEGVPEKAAEKLKKTYPGIKIAGTLSPEYGFEKREESLNKVISTVRNASPDILFMCLGAPKSELLLAKIKNELNVPLSLCVGASVDFISGNKKRAPKWMSDHGLEWFYRMCQEPGRLVKRYSSDALFIAGLLAKSRASKKQL